MSDSNNPAPAPASAPATADSTAPAAPPVAKKKRSTVELVIVRGGILILLALVGIESVGYLAQRSAQAALLERMQAGDAAGKTLKPADVKALVGRDPVHVEDVTEKNLAINAKRVEVYQWFTLSPFKKRELYVYYGIGTIDDKEDIDVINVSTDEDTDTYKHEKPVQAPHS